MTTTTDDVEPRKLSDTLAAVPRFYDASLGGKDAYEDDQEALWAVLSVAPDFPALNILNRQWLTKTVRYCAEAAGIAQFIDLGCGYPRAENTHDVAQGCNATARVAYVDHDPIVLAHGRALLTDNDQISVIAADFTQPEQLLAELASVLDFDKPMMLFSAGALHYVPDEQEPAAIMANYVDALPSGSYVALSHYWNPGEENPALADLACQIGNVLHERLGTGYYRSRTQIAEMFGSATLLPPGLVEPNEWRPSGPHLRPRLNEERLMLVGIAHKR